MKHKPGRITLKHIDWVGLILTTDLPVHCKALAMYLARFMNRDQDVAWPSQARIVSELSMPKATLNKYLAIMEREGWIVREKGGPQAGTKGGINTRYYIAFPKMVEGKIEQLGGSPPRGLVHDMDELEQLGSPPRGPEVVHHVDTNYPKELSIRDTHPSPHSGSVATKIPENFQPNEANLSWMKARGATDADITKIVGEFRDYWQLREKRQRNWQLVFRRNPKVDAMLAKCSRDNGVSIREVYLP